MKESTVFMVGDKESGQLMLKRPRVSDGFLGKVFFFFFSGKGRIYYLQKVRRISEMFPKALSPPTATSGKFWNFLI